MTSGTRESGVTPGRPERARSADPIDRVGAAIEAGRQGSPHVVSVVINYRGLVQTVPCIESLLAVAYDNHTIVVVDNASPGGDAEAIRETFGDRIEVIAGEQNLGYGGGANLGLRRALELGAEYAWVLNNDTIISPEAPGILVEAMEADQNLGCVTPQISAPIGPEAPAGVWFSGGTVRLSRGNTRHSNVSLAEGAGVVPTGYVAGCAMFLRCAALENVGLFWEPLFLFWEDADLSLRLHRAGWGLGVVAKAWIRHDVHGSISSPLIDYYYFRNAVLTARRHGHGAATLTAFMWLSGRIWRLWAGALLRRRPAPTAAARGLLSGAVLAIRRPAMAADRR